MECAFGLTGKDYVLLASDMSAGRSIIQMKSDENKIKILGPHLAMAFSGEPGDTNNFADYVDRNLRLFQIRNHVPLTPTSASAWIRRTLAESIRSRSPYAVNLLLAGLDTSPASVAERGVTSHLYWIDYLGTKAVVPYAAHGLGQYVCLSTMDKWWRPEMDAKGGVDVLKMCVDEVEKRLTVKFNFNCILITPNGIFSIDLKSSEPLAEFNQAQAQAQTQGQGQSEGQAASGNIAPPAAPVEVGA